LRPGDRTALLPWLMLLGASLALTAPAVAQLTPNEVELEDVIAIEVLGRELIAYDLLGTASPKVTLDMTETVSWMRSVGRVGLAMTGTRVLAISPGTGGWRVVRFGVHEIRPGAGFVGARVALVVTDRRILGFDSRSATWTTQALGPNEEALQARVGDSTAIVVTNRTAYGFSPGAGGFSARPLSIHERVEGLRVTANMATLSTSQRLLVFRAPNGIWTEERRPLH
jgi:hypothetical protein